MPHTFLVNSGYLFMQLSNEHQQYFLTYLQMPQLDISFAY